MTKRGQRTKCTKKRKITGTTWCQALTSSFLLLLIKSMLQVEATIEGKQQRHNVEVPFNVNSFILKSPLLSEREKKENFKLRYCLGRKKGGKENTIVWFLSTERPFQGGGRQLFFLLFSFFPYVCTTLVDYISFITPAHHQSSLPRGQEAGVTVNTIRPGQIPSMGRMDERCKHRNNQQSALITTATCSREGKCVRVCVCRGQDTHARSNLSTQM